MPVLSNQLPTPSPMNGFKWIALDQCDPIHPCPTLGQQCVYVAAFTGSNKYKDGLCPNCRLGEDCSNITFNLPYTLLQNPCPMGKVCPQPNRIMDCPVGYVCPSGSFNPMICDTLGTYCPVGSSIPMPCSAGFYCPNATQKINCPIGSFCKCKKQRIF